MKLFPNLERVCIKEHAKSNNYEDYIGVVLDKKHNNFKVVEGKFTDKKDMYRKMKARGLILRKAYERKVWEWIEANADGVIIAYLMLSTAFSKWRSNNVLHKYYQKLLQDIPELNREREKGNPNTRGGDFITTDDEDAPKRQDESTELEEADEETHMIQLIGVPYGSDKEEPIISRFTDDKGIMSLKSAFWLNTNGKFKNPEIAHIVDDIMNTNNSSTVTGVDTQGRYKEIKVFVDGKLEKVYDSKKIGSDVREIDTGRASFEKDATSNIVAQANEKIRELYNKLEAGNLSAKEEKDIKNQISFLRMQKQQVDAEKHVDINNLRHTWQAKIASTLGRDNEEARQQLSDSNELLSLLMSLISVSDEKQTYDRYISNAIAEDKRFSALNKSFSMVTFDPLTSEQLKGLYNKIKQGEPVSEDKQERKTLLHNLIWYVLADGRMFKQGKKSSEEDRLGVNRANKLGDLLQRKQATGLSGFNHKTQSGKANADVQVGDLSKLQKEIDKLSKEPIYVAPTDRKITTPFNKTSILELKMSGLSRKIRSLEKKIDDENLSKQERDELISNKEDLENQLKILTKEYNNESEVDKSKIYSSDGKSVKKLNPKDGVRNSSYKTDRYEIPQKEAVYDNNGATSLHNSIPYQGKGFGYSAGPLKMTGQIVEDTTKTELNPKLFEKDMLIPEVRDALYKIATVFKDYLDLPFEIKDIYLTGSNANYNYTDDSDIDLHLVYDFEQAGANAELLSKYLIAAKKDFNDKYNIKVKGLPVELGCENLSEPLVSTGVYSLGANSWVIKPENSAIEIPDVDMNAFNDLSTQIDNTIKAQNASAIENLWKSIKNLRKHSLSDEGEFGMGNLLFKKLRNADYLERLRNSMYNTKSKDLSLESSENLEEAELNDKKDYSEYLKDLKDELENKETQDLLCDRSLVDYLDGYKDKGDKQEVEFKDGVLNEDIPTWKLNRAERQLKNGIPPQALEVIFTDLDGSLCKFKYVQETKEEPEHLYKIPVKRTEVLDGVYRFIGNPDEAKEIDLDEFWEILDSPINQKRHSKTSVNVPMGVQQNLISDKRTQQKEDFDKWYEENEDVLRLDEISPDDKKKRNRILREIYKYSKMGFSVRDIKDYFGDLYSNLPQDDLEEASGDRLKVNKDTNAMRDILIAVNTNDKDPLFLAKYITRPIYQNLKQRNPKTFKFDDIQKQWQIVGMDDVSKYISEDGKFDFSKMPADQIHISLVNTAPDAVRDRMTVNLHELKNLINSCKDNDPEVENPSLAADIYNSKRPYRQQTSKTYTRRLLLDREVKAAINYVKSDEYKQKIKENIVKLSNLLKSVNPEKDPLQFREYSRMLNHEKFKLMLSNTKKQIDTIEYLNAVEDGVHIEKGNGGYFIKLPENGFTYQDVKNRGAYQPEDMIKQISKGVM